ncbi:MAG: hypothetical protein LBS93_04120 [Synergistaceae bacterium]|jgi:autotransporter-associated beta strand protein|nr:hypothetical protein [Synergistaceae bacterium]
MRTIRKTALSLIALAITIAAASGTARAGIGGGKLNGNNSEVDLTSSSSYEGGNLKKQITLETGQDSVTLPHNLVLWDDRVSSGSTDSTEMAKGDDANGAVYLGVGQTLNIRPDKGTGKKVLGRPGNISALRLFGAGTTNLYEGDGNSYSVTFVQSGRLNVESRQALGGSEVTLGGGAVIGCFGDTPSLDLRGVKLNVRRYGAESAVTFDTGAKSITVDDIGQVAGQNALSPADSAITLVKAGSGTLTVSGVANHSGGSLITGGTLAFKAAPSATQTIEINPGAVLSSNVKTLTNVTIKPHSGSSVAVPAVAAVPAARLQNTGDAALLLASVDSSAIGSSKFTVKADLSGLRRPEGPEADLYYVALLHAKAHGLSEKNVAAEGSVPAGFSAGSYVVRTALDADNVYAVLSRDLAPRVENLGVTLYNGSKSKNIINVLVNDKSNNPFPAGTNFTYRFIGKGGVEIAADIVSDGTLFWADGVEFNERRTRALFQIDLDRLVDETKAKRRLSPGRLYEIRVEGTGGSSGAAGTSTLLVMSDGSLTELPSSDSHDMKIEVSADARTGVIETAADVLKGGQSIKDGTIVSFHLCDAFGEPVKISGVQTVRTVSTAAGRAKAKFERLPAGRYIVRVSSPEFNRVGFSNAIRIDGSGGDGGGCDSGIGILVLAALGAIKLRSRL